MNKHLNKSDGKKILLQLMIMFVCILGLALVKGCRKKTSVPTEDEPAKLPGIVQRSLLAEQGWYTGDAEALNKQI